MEIEGYTLEEEIFRGWKVFLFFLCLRELPGGAMLKVAVATVRHSEVHRVGPERRVVEGRCDGGVVEERLLLHHGELVVPAHSEVRGPHTDHAVVRQIGEFLRDDPHPRHFLSPVVHRGVRPETLIVVVT